MDSTDQIIPDAIEKIMWVFMVVLYGGTLLAIVFKAGGYWRGF
jgi:hypothetical protein